MTSVSLLEPPAYAKDERQALIDFLLDLKKSHIREFLKSAELPTSGTKAELRKRVAEALAEKKLTHERIVEYLDTMAPWGKQHVFLYNGPRSGSKPWRDPDHVLTGLKRHRLGKLFNARLPLILPDKLTLSSISHSDDRLRVTAVQRREYTERAPKYDSEGYDEKLDPTNGAHISFKAYAHYVSRTLVSFEWDLAANVAMLQITQLKQDALYEKVAGAFHSLVGGWLDIENSFGPVDIRNAIRQLHLSEGNGQAEARSHGIQYRTLRGRQLAARSPSPQDSVFGEDVIDHAMDDIATKGVGHLGNFYWLPEIQPGPVPNPLSRDIHVVIVGDKSRIMFPTPNSEEIVRYVLHRVRALS